MRRCGCLVLVLSAVGCFTPEIATRNVMNCLNAVGGPVGQDVVIIDVAEIEQPPDDAYIDRELWTFLDEQAVGLEHKMALDDNGLRAGVVGGLPPGKLQAMLITERSCPNPHRVTTRSGTGKQLNVGPQHPETQFEQKTKNEVSSFKLASGQFGFLVTPHRIGDGRVRLTFLPQVQHGGRTLRIQPIDGDGWSLAGAKTLEKFSTLSFEVTLSPQDYLVIGTRYDRANTIGHAMFVGPAGDRIVQRLLVIRARPQGEDPLPEWNFVGTPRTQPLAVQAVKSTRGSRD